MERKMLVARGWEEGGRGSYCLMGTQFWFCKMKKLWKWMVVMVLYHNLISK